MPLGLSLMARAPKDVTLGCTRASPARTVTGPAGSAVDGYPRGALGHRCILAEGARWACA